ncbi:Predicted 3-hydroxylacyl-ACP dehydratase, HotDog domain [Ferrimonas sediminum]|uniref:Predicted 3-hydroxylacyl-ACP dehydratase, HotDog domain n=1 Tax=Ferrimonas sediminum TaxID=718193 RepID=A0A1G8N8Q1_9GAMM|nr:Predicted 3-hydroxylacyl-ACP dehydratase, HotDog domain [Ferrimonas sediminum]
MSHPLAAYLPHDEPMILIDELVSHQDNRLCCQLQLSETSPFYDAKLQRVPEWVGMEYMAQTVAALAGIEAHQQGRPVRIGFLLGTRRYTVHNPAFELGKPYRITVERLYQDSDGMASFQCDIHQDEIAIASAKINVFQPNNVNEFLGTP